MRSLVFVRLGAAWHVAAEVPDTETAVEVADGLAGTCDELRVEPLDSLD